jgi:hypothetical protein
MSTKAKHTIFDISISDTNNSFKIKYETYPYEFAGALSSESSSCTLSSSLQILIRKIIIFMRIMKRKR